jgi:DNA-binding GntR family transcriptional regulator
LRAPIEDISTATGEVASVSPSAEEPSVDYRTKVDVAYEQLRRWILTGRLKPGEKLDQAWLARHMHVSRTPLRQALLRLAAERLIEAEPHRSAVVAPLSLIEVEDLYQSRCALESMLAKAGATNLNQSTLSQMRDILAAQERAVDSGDPDRFTELDREFHFVLYRAAGYARAYHITQELRDASERYVRFYAVYKNGAAESLVEHRRIFELCVAGDVETVRHDVEHHVLRGLETLRAVARETQ